MKHTLLLATLALGLALPVAAQMPAGKTPTVVDDPALVQRYQATITPQDLAAHLYLFASDLFEGRETSARGQKLAAHYLASQYERMGLTPKGSMQTDNPMSPDRYLQSVPLYGRRLNKTTLTATRGGTQIASSTFGPTSTDGQALLLFGGKSESKGGLTFLGYGIADDERGYNDFQAAQEAQLTLGGNWLMVLDGEPMQNGKSLLTDDGSPSSWTTESFAKLRGAFQNPAAQGFSGLIVVSRDATFADRATKAGQAQAQSVGSLSLNPPEGEGRTFPPVFFVSEAFANTLLANSGQTVAELADAINSAKAPSVFAVEGVEVTNTMERATFNASSENVAAFIEGSDLKDEVVVISSHYDHIGINPAGNEDGDTINNGADDDGSGTVSVLEIAEAFAKAKADGYGPRRSILFLNVTGEEKGLLGSAYYADIEPLVPLENTVTNLNIDMVGRRDPTYDGPQADNYVYIIGSNLISQELHDLNAQANKLTGINMDLSERFNSKDDPNQFYRRSDHWNFGKKGIPFIFYFNGTHEDYHGLDDEPEKIDYPQMAKRAQVIFATAWQVANQDAAPAVSGEGFN